MDGTSCESYVRYVVIHIMPSRVQDETLEEFFQNQQRSQKHLEMFLVFTGVKTEVRSKKYIFNMNVYENENEGMPSAEAAIYTYVLQY